MTTSAASWQEQPEMLKGPAGALEAIISSSADINTTREIIGIICHPHPLHGGSMNNKVVTTVARALRDLNIPSIRFNYRGVGKSDGSFAEGVGETEDALAVIQWAQQQWPTRQLWLAGFSFGAYVSLAATVKLNTPKITQLISIAPAVNHAKFAGLQAHCPWLVIQGQKDEVVPADHVIDWVSHLHPAPELILFPNATHFFNGELISLRQQLVEKLTHAHAL